MSTDLTDAEREMLSEAFDDAPSGASSDWVITRAEWKRLYAAVEAIVAARVAAVEAERDSWKRSAHYIAVQYDK